MHQTTRTLVIAALTALLIPGSLEAQARRAATTGRTTQPCTAGDAARTGRTTAESPPQQGEYDVVLDIPDLCVDEVQLDVRSLEAHLALNARVANLVRVDAGADVTIGGVSLGIRGVRAQALLLIDLDNVVYVVDRTLAFIDQNPGLITGLFRTTQGALTTVGGIANTTLQEGGVVDNAVGTVDRTLDNVAQPLGAQPRQ